jgi:hypothetical protein
MDAFKSINTLAEYVRQKQAEGKEIVGAGVE